MIKQVRIKNFQSHKDSVLDFVPGVNVIIGPSDSGKSAIFRAINWVLTNRPLGDGFRSEWGGETRVTIITTDGHTVERVKGDDLNAYILDGEKLKAFGAGVPDDVLTILRIAPESVQSQGEPPFLLSASPGEAARLLNRAASLDDIDRVIANLRRSYTASEKRVEQLELSITECKNQLIQYRDLDQVEALLEQAEKLERKYQDAYNDLLILRDLYGRAIEIEERLADRPDLGPVSEMVEEASSLVESLNERKDYLKKLRSLVGKIRDVKDEMANLLTDDEIERVLSLIDAATRINSDLERTKNERRRLIRLLDRIHDVDHEIVVVERKIEELEKRYHEIAPETCPLCGGRMST